MFRQLRYRVLIYLTAAWVSPSLRADAQTTPDLYEIPDFEEVKQAALDLSLETKRAILLRDQATIDRSLVKYADLPSLVVTASAGKSRTERAEASRAQTKDLSYGVQLNYKLYDFGKTDSQALAAAYQEKIRSLNIEEVNETLIWNVARAYLNFSMAAHLYQISNDNLAASQAKYDSVRRGYRQGLRPENDLISAAADLGDIRLTLEQAKADALLQRAYLEVFLGNFDFPSSGSSIGKNKATWIMRTPKDWETLFQTWPRAELSASQIRRAVERDSLEASVKAVQSSALPTLALRASAEEAGDWKDRDRIYTGQLLLTWDIMWSGRRRDELHKISLERNVIDTDEAIEQKQRREAGAVAYEKFQLTAKLAKVAADQVKLRFKQYQMARSRYEAGKSTSLELSNAELLLGNSRLAEARIANTLSAAALEYAAAMHIKDPSILFRRP